MAESAATGRRTRAGNRGSPAACATEDATLSVVVPVLDDAPALARLLEELSAYRQPSLEVLVVDGGSRDESCQLALRFGATLLTSAPGRGQQLVAGIAAARGTWLWLLHADSRDLGGALAYLLSLQPAPAWGRFAVRFAPSGPGLRLVAAMMSLRSRVTGICTGDQGIFVHGRLLAQAGGMPGQPLMEDIELSRRLRRLQRPRCPRDTITTSSRRWHQRGLIRTVLSMWRLRLRYWLGADPELLAREYYG